MGTGGERTRAASSNILRPKLLLSAALAALIVAAPTGERTSALAMNLGSSFGAARINSGPQTFVPKGNVGSTAIGKSNATGVVGRVNSGDGLSVNPCKPSRVNLGRCGPGKVVNGGGDGNPRPP